MTELEFFNPTGVTEVLHKHAPRLPTLSGKRIGFLSNGDWQSFRSLPLLRSWVKRDFPDADVLPLDAFPEGTDFISLTSTIDSVLAADVDAVIIGNAACGACSTACGAAAAQLEIRGVPTVLVTREEFVGVVQNAVSGFGLSPDLAMVTFPIDLFLPESELAPVVDRRTEIWAGLTEWESSPVDELASVRTVRVRGRDYADAFAKANDLMAINHWGDGLPLWPATHERVDWILQGCDLPRDHRLGKFPPRGAVATIESCAIALAMAGGRPEYLPILVAAVEAMLDPASNGQQMQATSAGTFPVVIVNGPIAKDIRLNSGFGCLGPDPKFPAGASIGRALRQIQQNLGGAMPGKGTMAPWGAMRFNNAVFAENEDALPAGWESHAVTRHGFSAGENSISFFWATGASNVVRRGAKEETRDEDAVQGLLRTASYLAAPSAHYAIGWDSGTPGAVLLTPAVARQLAASGWTQEKVRDFLWKESRIPLADLKANGILPWIQIAGGPRARQSVAMDPWPITSSPEQIILVLAGGDHPTHAFWMQAIAQDVIGKKVATSRHHDQLVAQATRDLGCADDVCAF